MDEKQLLTQFLDSIRAYEHEANKSLAEDDRDSIEFVNIFLNGEHSYSKYN